LLQSDGDVAALVYRQGENPDALLRRFAIRRQGLGLDVLGVVQRRERNAARGTKSFELLLMSGDQLISETGSAGAMGNLSPTAALDRVATYLSRELRRRPDIVILNRFGSFERAGAGLVRVLAEAIQFDVPVVIAVPEALFGDWIVAVAGLAVKVKPNLAALEHWWRSLSRAPSPGAAPESFCSRFK
jgi:hypothetical protein